jgi:DNA-directed RNA polymerase beta' subunit
MRSAGATARLVKDVIPVPVNVRRVLDDILFEHGQKDTPAQFDPFETLQAVDAACSALPYAFTNPWREHERVAMPVYVQCATRIMALTIRATFSLRELARVGATNNVITAALRRIRSLYEEALIQPGMSVGILAAQNMIEPLTQYVLNAHHRSGAQGTSLNVITRFKELVGARAGPALVGTTMTFRLRDGVDDITAHSVAARVESLTFSQFVTAWQIFYEQFGRPEHPDYVGEREMIRAHQRYSARGVAVPSDLSRWCLRFELNRTVMVEKSLDLDTIVQQLHVLFPDTYIVYTPESVAHIVIRIYLRVGKRAASRDDVTKTLHIILDSVIRGTPGVVNARVDDEVSVSRIGANGAISDAKCNIVVTGGTNISAILEMCARGQEPLIDPASVRTSDMHEIMRVYGVEALRTAIITEFESLLPDVASPHYTVYADEMTYTGDYTGIERNPANRADVLLTAATGSPVQALEAASLNGARSVVAGVIPPIILGQAPALGTAFPQIVVNPDAEKVRGVDDLLAQL